MEKRIGVVAIVIQNHASVKFFNDILSDFHDIILARQGLPLHERKIHVISLVVEGSTDQIGALTGRIGKLDGIQVKSIMTKTEASHARNIQ